MRQVHYLVLGRAFGTALAMALGACATMPEEIPELEDARAQVTNVEQSTRAGVAAQDVAEARRALDRADRLAEEGADREDIRYEATVASKHAQIADERIAAAEAREEIARGNSERQTVLLEVREREAQAREQEARAAEQRADSLQEQLEELKAQPTPRGMVVTLQDVLFETGKAELQPGAMSSLAQVAEVLREDPQRKVAIEGHTDNTGSPEFNQALSERRAQAVKDALVSQGASPDQITTRGLGPSSPVASNDNAAGRQQNRRVELVFAEEPAQRGGG